MDSRAKGSLAFVAALVLAFVGWTWAALPHAAAAVLTVACLLAFAGWAATGLSRPVRSRSVVALYLCAVAFQILHLAEEWTGDFPHEIVMLTGSARDWPLDEFLWVFVFGAGALWVLGGAGALVGSRVANWFLWMYALGAGLVNALAHFVFPVVKGGYVPGLYTAPGHLLLSVLLVAALVREDQRLRRGAGAERPDPVAVRA